MTNLNREDIRSAIKAFEKKQAKKSFDGFLLTYSGSFQRAAVVIPLIFNDKEWQVLLTKRSDNLADHSGQVAFPGGAYENQDKNLLETALREMYEEIGVKPDDADVFGHLGDTLVVTGYRVRPYVAQIPWPYPLKISKDEVDSTFTISLNWLADPQNRYIKMRTYAGQEIPVIYFNRYNGYQLWGASAEMALTLFSALNMAE